MTTDPFIYLQFIRKILLPMPGVTEGISHGTPALYVQKKIIARIKEDGQTLAAHNVEREKWITKDPETFFITDHYLNYAYVLVNLVKVEPVDLEKLLIDAWLGRASKTLIKEYKER